MTVEATPGLNPVLNPYTPGAGTPPPVLAGRDEQLRQFDVVAQRIRAGLPEQALGLSGLRGVGKTVLLRTFVDIAEHRGLHVAVVEGTDGADAALRTIARRLRRILLALKPTDGVVTALRTLKSFSLTMPLGVKLEVEPLPGHADSGDLVEDVADVLAAAGAAARSDGTGVVVAVDEVQDMPALHVAALAGALHRSTQERLPVGAVLAGLPSSPAHLARAKSYAERMVAWTEVDRLDDEAAAHALEQPATALGVRWHADAVGLVLERTGGYPYFLQEYGRHTWNVAAGDPIGVADVERAEPRVRAQLDEGFFRARLGRIPDSERRYVRALASLGPGEHRSGAVAAAMGATTSAVAPLRERLIAAGALYSPRYGYVAFSVPRFDDYVRRTLPGDPLG